MGVSHRLLAVTMILATLAIVGCKSKQDKPIPGVEAPQNKSTAVPQGKPVAVAATAQEKTDARAAATHVIAQMVKGDFAGIYEESAPSFKQLGSKSLFVAKFDETRKKVGALKNPKEISFDSRSDAAHVLVYRLENEQFISDMRLTFVRTKSGKMLLVGLNQHDELKK